MNLSTFTYGSGSRSLNSDLMSPPLLDTMVSLSAIFREVIVNPVPMPAITTVLIAAIAALSVRILNSNEPPAITAPDMPNAPSTDSLICPCSSDGFTPS